MNLTAVPAWTAAVLMRVKLTLSAGLGGGGLLLPVVGGVVDGPEPLGGDDAVLLVLGDGSAEGDDGVEGDGVWVAAKATGAVPLTRTNPVPAQMISGFRTDRASTAHNLLNHRL